MGKGTIIGRKEQIKTLERIASSKLPEFLVLYGRRRVGKTFLIREYFSQELVFDFTGSYGVDMNTQLNNFFHEYLLRTKGQKETTPPANWSRAFQYLLDYITILKKRKSKLVVFIDELPWLDTPRSGFVSALEYFWNQQISKMNHVLLIGCGSATSWIQKKLLKAKGGLYNRVTQRIKLEPFTLEETEAFCKYRNLKLSRYQILQIYMVMGGIPHYLKELTSGKSAIQLIDDICFSKTGLLREEYSSLYHSLFKNPENHLAIIETLGSRPNGMVRKGIVQYSKLPDGGTVNRTLEELTASGFISRFRPYQKKKKDSIYKLTDLFTLFHIKFIQASQMTGKGTWMTLSNSGSYKAWSGYAYETICMLHIDQIKKALGVGGVYTEISAWKFAGNDESPGAQIDLLIDRKDQVINLCEAKFTDKEYIITKSYAGDLRRKRSIFQQVTNTKKSVFTTLITTYPAIRNRYYLEEIQSEITMDALFEQ
jgi:AAA+ ATPase superfamily predicted ATPase